MRQHHEDERDRERHRNRESHIERVARVGPGVSHAQGRREKSGCPCVCCTCVLFCVFMLL